MRTFPVDAGMSTRGIALLTVLWVITLLMVIVLSFTALVRTEANSSFAFREMIAKKYLAEAGIARGIAEILFLRQRGTSTLVIDENSPWKADGTANTGDLGAGHYMVRIVDESGKISINTLTDASGIILKNLLIQRGATSEEADTIVDSLLDWKDGDDLHRLQGAESDYYLSLPNPYSAKNANFVTLEELLLVKGMKPEILYGTPDRKGIADVLTVHAMTAKISVNAASAETLAAVPGFTAETAEAVVSERQAAGVISLSSVRAILGAGFAAAAPFIDARRSNTYTIDSRGYRENEKAGYTVRATVIFKGNEFSYLYFKSPSWTEQ